MHLRLFQKPHTACHAMNPELQILKLAPLSVGKLGPELLAL